MAAGSFVSGMMGSGGFAYEGIADLDPVAEVIGNPYNEQARIQGNRAVETQKAAQAAEIRTKMRLAQEFGIHPLSMLGVPISAVGSGGGLDNLGGFGIDFGRHAEASKPSEKEERLMDAHVRKAEAEAGQEELAYERARRQAQGQPGRPLSTSADVNAKRQADLAGVPRTAVTYGGSPSFAGSADTGLIQMDPDKVVASSPRDAGVAAGVRPGTRVVQLPNGKQMMVFDQDAVQMDLDDGSTVMALMNLGMDPKDAITTAGIASLAPLVLGAGGGLLYGGKKIKDALKGYFSRPRTEPYKFKPRGYSGRR